jgi:hypothetical protein
VKLSKEAMEHQKRLFEESHALPLTNDENFYQQNEEAAPLTASRAARIKHMTCSNVFSGKSMSSAAGKQTSQLTNCPSCFRQTSLRRSSRRARS